jgi:hypothetical protein
MKKKNYYLVLGNHLNIRGIDDQVLVIETTFKKAKIDIKKTIEIKPNEINIVIEEFHKDFAEIIFDVKKKFPKTKIILFSTEFLTGNAKNRINCFNFTDIAIRLVLKNIFIFLIDCPVVQTKKNYLSFKINRFLSLFLTYCFLMIGRNFNQDLMFARREYWLFKLKDLFDAVIASSEPVLNSYNSFIKGQKIYLPVFVDSRRLKLRLNEKTGIKKNIFFSGNLTFYRKKVIEFLNNPLLDKFRSYPLVFSKGEFNTINFYPKILSVINLSGNKDCFNEIPLYEIYIPQSKSWPYSSPNRSIFSFKHGCIPISYGYFDQHSIDQLFLIQTKNPNDFYDLQKKDPNLIIRRMLSKIDHYNRSQLKILKQFKIAFDSI